MTYNQNYERFMVLQWKSYQWLENQLSRLLKISQLGYSRSESCCKQKMVFTPISRSLSTSAGVCNQRYYRLIRDSPQRIRCIHISTREQKNEPEDKNQQSSLEERNCNSFQVHAYRSTLDDICHKKKIRSRYIQYYNQLVKQNKSQSYYK